MRETHRPACNQRGHRTFRRPRCHACPTGSLSSIYLAGYLPIYQVKYSPLTNRRQQEVTTAPAKGPCTRCREAMGVTIPCDRRHPKASAWLCAALEGCEPAPQSAGASHASTCPLPTPMPASSGASRARSHAATGAGRPAGTIPSGPTLRGGVPAATRRAQRQPWLGGWDPPW